jgi:hypothetical protein
MTVKTKIATPQDAIDVLNQNLEGLLSGKRKVMVVKEVNNTVGKMLDIHKLEAASKALSGDKTPLAWFDQPKLIENEKALSK